MTFLLSMKGVKWGLLSHNLMFLKNSLILLSSTRKKSKLIFVMLDVLFVDVRHILDNCNSQELPLEE